MRTSNTSSVCRAGGGFSLIELLIVLAMILIMYYMLMSRGARSYQRQQLAVCSKNLQNIYVALNIYANDNKDRYPVVPDAKTSEEPLSLLVPKCTTATEMFTCPGSKDVRLRQGEPFAKEKISYAYYMGWKKSGSKTEPLVSDRQVDTARKRQGQVAFSTDGKPPGDNHSKYGGNVLFADGEIQATDIKTEYDLLYPTNVTLLNPKR
ncbi:MAG: type II secretion system protein [Verrucomicrobiota bacterium]